MNISELEAFLQTLNLSEKHRNFKGFEVDLRGNLNPTSMLNEIFWTKKEWLNIEEFFIEEFFERYVRMMYPDLKRMFAKEIGQLGAKFGSHLAARLYRTQVGFLTEYHCAALCQEIFEPEGFAVRRSPDLEPRARNAHRFSLSSSKRLYSLAPTAFKQLRRVSARVCRPSETQNFKWRRARRSSRKSRLQTRANLHQTRKSLIVSICSRQSHLSIWCAFVY